MNILFTLRFFPVYGGGETVTIRLAEKFAADGHNVFIFYLWENGKYELSSNVSIFRAPNISNPIGKEAIRKENYSIIEKELSDFIRNNRIEYIINQWLPPRIVWNASSKNAFVFNCRHASVYINSKKWNFARKIFGKNLFDSILRKYYHEYIECSDKYILLCKEYENEMQAIFNHHYDQKITSMLNPCRFDIPNNNSKDKENAICYVGRLYPEKQVDVLIRAWKIVEEVATVNKWKFYIVGNGYAEKDLKDLTFSLNCQNVLFEGYQNPIDYYKKSKIFVSASQTEGYPMTIVEAMAYGAVPVIANTYTALNGIIPDDMNGKKISRAEPDLFAESLIELINNADILQEKSFQAYTFCKQNFSIDDIANNWYKMLETTRRTTTENSGI